MTDLIDELHIQERWVWRDDVDRWWAGYRTPKGNLVAGRWVTPPKGYLAICGLDWSHVKESNIRAADKIARQVEEAT
jgi:hypothetical protein